MRVPSLTESVLSSSFSCPPAINTLQKGPAEYGFKGLGLRVFMMRQNTALRHQAKAGGIQLKKRGLANVFEGRFERFLHHGPTSALISVIMT